MFYLISITSLDGTICHEYPVFDIKGNASAIGHALFVLFLECGLNVVCLFLSVHYDFNCFFD